MKKEPTPSSLSSFPDINHREFLESIGRRDTLRSIRVVQELPGPGRRPESPSVPYSRNEPTREETFRKGLCILQILLIGVSLVGESESQEATLTGTLELAHDVVPFRG